MIKSEKIKQFSVSILVVLSLFVSSVAACCCAHHQEKQEIETASCHFQASEPAAEEHQNSEIKNDSQGRQINIPCECLFESAPKIIAKSENVKVEKQIPVFAAEVEAIRGFIAVRAPAPKCFEFESFRVSDSSYNIKSPRAPPRL